MFDASSLAAILSGVKSQQPAPVAPAPAPTSPLATNLGGILSGDPNFGNIIRQIGGGMANIGDAGGDPYRAFAMGFGGAQQYATQQEKEAAERAAAAEKQKMDADLALQRLTQDASQHSASLAQNQSQFDSRMTQDQNQFDQRMTLDQAAEKRQQMVADEAAKKTAAETKRLAQKADIDPNVMIKINDAAEQAGKNAYDQGATREEAQEVVKSERDRMIQQVKSGRLSDGPGISESETAPVAVPKIGDTVGKYQYVGGDPADPASWKAQ